MKGVITVGGSEWQALLSIVLSIVLTSMKLWEATSFFSEAAKIVSEAELEEGYANSDDLKRMSRNIKYIKIMCIMLLLFILYAAAKLVATYTCEDSMLNLTGCAS